MIFFDHENRGDPPAFFASDAVRAAWGEASSYYDLSADEKAQTDPPRIWGLPWGEDVLPALLSLSDGCCAFCEYETEGLRPWRFRPPAMAEGVKEDYLSDAFHWDNIFPICPGCTPLRPEHFPLRRGKRLLHNDQALLLYPGQSGNENAFHARMDGRLTGRNPRGRATLAHYNLNRKELVAARAGIVEEGALLQHGPLAGFRTLALIRLMKIIAREHPQLPRPAGGFRADNIKVSWVEWFQRINLSAALSSAIETARQEDQEADRAASTPKPRGPAKRITPRIDSVSISAFKSLESIAFSLPKTLATRDSHPAEAPCLMILGENSTGKSSILQAVALACLPPDQLHKLGLAPEKLVLNPEYLGKPDYMLMDPSSQITLTFHDGSTRKLRIDGRKGSFEPDGDTPPLVFAYGAHRLFGAKARRGADRHFVTLFHDDRQLSNPEDWLRGLWTRDRDSLNEVVAALRHIIQIDGAFESIGFPSEAKDAPCIIRLKRRAADGAISISPQPLAIVSSGFRAVLAMVCDIMAGLMAREGSARDARRARAIVLIDEIEAHLHPRWKLQIMDGLRRALPHVTFILTSHDPLCLRGMFNGEVMALNRYHREDAGAWLPPERIERVEAFENIEAMTVDQLLTSDLFQLLSADAIGTERQLARAADRLSGGRETAAVRAGQGPEAGDLAALDAEIAAAMPAMATPLPIGRTEAGRLVQETVAEFLAARRSADAATTSAARQRAKAAVHDWLRELMP